MRSSTTSSLVENSPQKSEKMTKRKGLNSAATKIDGESAATAWPRVTLNNSVIKIIANWYPARALSY